MFPHLLIVTFWCMKLGVALTFVRLRCSSMIIGRKGPAGATAARSNGDGGIEPQKNNYEVQNEVWSVIAVFPHQLLLVIKAPLYHGVVVVMDHVIKNSKGTGHCARRPPWPWNID